MAETYPHSGSPEPAVALYRRLLRAQPDHSVTIVSIGALTNLAQLLATDRALVQRKVAGSQVFVGNNVCAAHPEGSPVRAAFDILYGCGNQQRDGTWDPTALYYAIYGTARAFRLTGKGGHNVVTPDGLNAWTPGGRRQQFLLLPTPPGLPRTPPDRPARCGP
jgi:hypothetical protein